MLHCTRTLHLANHVASHNSLPACDWFAWSLATLGNRHKEAQMHMTQRLNVLLALLSFGFIAAVIFGMV